jgi:very-short-patch-repair endonuclease
MEHEDRVVRSSIRHARDLRQDATFPERLLWSRLRGRRFFGLKFRRQHPIDSFVLDFYCDEAKLAVEVDGETHVGRGQADDGRSALLSERGIQVVRVTNDDVLRDIDAVLAAIARAAGERRPD